MCLVDVIVPVHGAGPVFRRCAASLIAHADASGADAAGAAAPDADGPDEDGPAAGRPDASAAGAAFRLVIVLDGPPDVESLAAVEELRAAARREVGGFELSVLSQGTPVGFLRSANRALRDSTRDVVLLNSDTQVTAGWLDRLRAAAYSDSKIATVTPFSNNATICSLPRFLDENAIPAGYTIDSFGGVVTRVSRREYPRLPTGVGFCLYVKRSVLDEVGLFDEAFGLGYGEEVDLCLRAASRGYVHVLDDATFIFHEGSRSFGSSREQHMRRGERLLLSRFPNYLRDVAEFIKKDPIASARVRVLDELRRSGALDELARSEGEGAVALPNEMEALSPGESVSTTARSNRTPGAPVSTPAPVWVRGPSSAGAEWPQRALHLLPGWPPWTSSDAAATVRGVLRDQSARREVFVYARMTDPDRADGAAVEYLDGGIRVRLIVANSGANTAANSGLNSAGNGGANSDANSDASGGANGGWSGGASRAANGIASGTRRTMLERLGVRPDPVGEDFVRFLGEVRPQVVHAHDLAGQTFDLLGSARARAIRAALKNIDAFVMGSQSLAESYAAARVLPRSAHVTVSALPLRSPLPSTSPSPAPSPADGSREAREEIEGSEDIERVYAEIMSSRSPR